MVSALIALKNFASQRLLKLAEKFFSKIEKKYIKNEIYHSYSKDIVFIEDYAFLINASNDLSDKPLISSKDLARKLSQGNR